MTAGADEAAAVATITAVSTLIGVAITSVFSVLVPLLKEAVGGAKERERERRRQIAEALLELQALAPEVVVARMVNVPGNYALTKKLHEEMGKTWNPVALSGFAQMLPLGRLELLVKESEHVIVDIGLNATEAPAERHLGRRSAASGARGRQHLGSVY